MNSVSIIVESVYETSTGGWQVRLEKADPQGINDRVLILDLVAIPPAPGIEVTQAVERHKPKYIEMMVDGNFYEGVEVRRARIGTNPAI